jgi:hypothetical protein
MAFPKFRTNGTVDYPWHGERKCVLDYERCSFVLPTAWIAGAGDPEYQAFDVWLAFEFPPLVSKVPRENASSLHPGTYRIVNPMFLLAAEVEEGDSTDGTPIVLARQNPGRQQKVRNRDVLRLFFHFRALKSFLYAVAQSLLLLKLSTIA